MSAPQTFLDFDSFRIDVRNRLLLSDGEVVALTPKAFDTLRVLVERRGEVVTKEELIQAVWSDAFITEATLTQNIYTLRKVLAAAGSGELVQTVPRRGYRFVGEVVEVADLPESPRQTDPAVEPRDSPGAGIRSLAVLPLVPLAGDEEIVFLGLGLADAVIASLSHVHRLTVRATSSIMRYVDQPVRDPVEIGRALEVDGVLEGTIQRSGARLRVTVQLVSVARGAACWAESFQGLYDDLFEAQDAIAQAVVAGLRLTLSTREEQQLAHHATDNTEACRAYARGRYAWNKRTAADLQRSIEHFQTAAKLDPSYARAYAGLADALILLPFYGAAEPRVAFAEARRAARQAAELDNNLAEAHTSLAYTDFVYSRRWRTAEERFLRALRLNPHYPTAHHWYAFLLTALGRHDEAIELSNRALRLEPLSMVIHTDLAMAYYFARRYDEAVSELSSVLEGDPDFGYARFGLALSWSALGQHTAAVSEARQACELLSDSGAVRGVLGYVAGMAGDTSTAQEVLRGFGQAAEIPVQAGHRALAQLGLHRIDEAFDDLLIACDESSRFAVFLGVWPVFDRMRSDPRFAKLLRRIRLQPA